MSSTNTVEVEQRTASELPLHPMECEGLPSKTEGIRPVSTFWASFEVQGSCWVWTKALKKKGYGITKAYMPDYRTVIVHRMVYKLLVEDIPQGMVIDHMCHNKACSNPRHLRLLTPTENTETTSSGHGRSKVRGVRWSRGKWRVSLTHLGVLHSGGTYSPTEFLEAVQASIDLRNRYHKYNDSDIELQRMVDYFM